MRYVIKNEHISVTVDTLGAEVVSALGADGFEYIWSGEAWNGHAPLLFPFCGVPLNEKYTLGGVEYPMAKHGFARRSEFTVEEVREDEITLSLSPNEKTRAMFPFEFKLVARYTLVADSLTARFTVENNGDVIMPFIFGWHPAYNLGGEAELSKFSVDFMCDGPLTRYSLQNGPFVCPTPLEFPLDGGKYFLNEKEIYENDTLILTGARCHVKLSGEGDSHGVDLFYSENLPYFCIWKAPVTEARYLCLEPWSGTPADGTAIENFDTKPMCRIGKGESESFTYITVFNK